MAYNKFKKPLSNVPDICMKCPKIQKYLNIAFCDDTDCDKWKKEVEDEDIAS